MKYILGLNSRPRFCEEDRGLWYMPAYFASHGETTTTRMPNAYGMSQEPTAMGVERTSNCRSTPPSIALAIVQELHSSPVGGTSRCCPSTQESSAQLLSPDLETWVRKYIGSCNACAVS